MPAGVLIAVGAFTLLLGVTILRRQDAAARTLRDQHVAQRRRSQLNRDRVERELSRDDPRVERLRALACAVALLVVGVGFVVSGVARAV